LAPGAAAQPPP